MMVKHCFLFIVLVFLFSTQDVQAKSRSHIAAENVTPDLMRDLKKQSLTFGNPIFIRIFKQDRTFVLFRSYPICTYSGKLGPKTRQGDNQAPEGFYRIGLGQLNPASSYHLSFNLGYPNAYDRAHKRTGDFLMVHGNCVSIGCYAMGDDNIEEIYTLLEAALRKGQSKVEVHIFPFDYDNTRLSWQTSPWAGFWKNLEQGYRAFNTRKIPPAISVKDKRYVVMGN
jgi:murein L,D-transpeptidase YafK